MGTGWRRAFCTSIRRDPAETTSSSISEQQQQSPSPNSRRSYVKLGIGGIFSSESSGGGGSSNPSTPRLQSTNSTPRCRTTTPSPSNFDSPRVVVQCKLPSDAAAATTPTSSSSSSSSSIISNNSKGSLSPRLLRSSSPRSPSRFALLKTALRLSRNRCGICGESVRTGDQRTAVFTAECSHAFHFPCISSHVRTQGCLVCPVCSATWHDVPLLSSSLHSPAAAAAGQFLGGRRSSDKLEDRSSSNTRDGRCREGERERVALTAGTTKIYDDDESLQLSPTNRVGVGALQFNPIPEELEAEDDDDADKDHEGQGQEDSDDCEQGCYSDRIDQIICVEPDSLALISTGRNHLSYVVSIRVKAPRLPPQPQAIAAPIAIPPSLLDHPSCRAPIDLVTVLDVSGSMTLAKLQMLKHAMRLVISSLGPGDRLSIVAFSMAAAKRLSPLCRMSRPGQRSACQIVDRLVISGSSQVQAQGQYQSHHCSSKSCMGNALRKATKVLEDRRERNPVATIILLSDGHCHGHGQEQQQEQNLHATCTTSSSRSQSHQPSTATRFTHIEIPIHALGDQKQSTRHKNNNMPVVEEEESVFAKHVNGLVSVVLQDVHLQFIFPCASGVISSVYSYPHGGECGDIGGIGQAMSHGEGGKSVFLGDLYAEEERQLLVELKVPKATALGGHAMTITLKGSYRDPLTREVIYCGEQPLTMPLPMSLQSQEFPILLHSSSSSSSGAAATSMTTQQQQQLQLQLQLQLRNVFVTTRAMAESRRLVELSDLDTALHLLSSARSLLVQQSTAFSNTHKKLVLSLKAQLEDLQKQQQQQQQRRWQPQLQSLSPAQRRMSEQALLAESRGGGEPLTPTSAWRAADQLAKVAIMRKSLNRVSDLHGLENARF